jgi:hypothetical protein
MEADLFPAPKILIGSSQKRITRRQNAGALT